jgi:hypothetical protein
MQVLRQEKYMYLFSTNFVLDFVNIPKRKIFYIIECNVYRRWYPETARRVQDGGVNVLKRFNRCVHNKKLTSEEGQELCLPQV